MKTNTFSLLSSKRQSLLSEAGLRDVQVLSLSHSEFQLQAQKLQAKYKSHFIVSETVAMRDFLGQEFSLVMLYLSEACALNVLFGVISTIESGGQLCIGYPVDKSLPDFYQSLVMELIQCQQQLSSLTTEKLNHLVLQRQTALNTPPNYLSAALALLKAKRRICVFAPRGYGKSTLLGMLVNALEQADNNLPIYLCAPSRASSSSVFKALRKGTLLKFISPERLSKINDSSIVFIDEAANCSQKFILENIMRFKYCIMATTSDGYEGQAQGFGYLMKTYQVAILRLNFCWRNSPNDYLQKFQNRYIKPISFATNTLPRLLKSNCLDTAQIIKPIRYRLLSSVLELKPSLRQAMIELLVTAHYRTTPNDLYQLMTSKCQYVLAMRGQDLIGVVVWQHEKVTADAREIALGRRRPSGNLLLQSLLRVSADLSIAKFSVARILRIAVLPNYQRHGVGTSLLTFLHDSSLDKIDLFGASFSSMQKNYQFWQSSGYKLLGVGLRKSPWLSAHALTVCRPVSGEASEFVQRQQSKAYQYLSYYADDLVEFKTWFHVKPFCHQDTCGLCFSLLSVIEGHRDVMYLLPEITSFSRSSLVMETKCEFTEQLHTALTQYVNEFNCLLSNPKISRFKALQCKKTKQKVKDLISQSLKKHNLIDLTKTNARQYYLNHNE